MSDTTATTQTVEVPPASYSYPAYTDDRTRRRSGVVPGIMLIVLGSAFLAAQVLPGLTWWMMWPLVFVVAGLAEAATPAWSGEHRFNRVLDGLTTAFFGVVLLGNTTGAIPWEMWITVIALWPVLLISVGLKVLGRASDQEWVEWLAPLVIWAALAYAVAVSVGAVGVPVVAPAWAEQTAAVVRAEVSQAIAGINIPAGQ